MPPEFPWTLPNNNNNNNNNDDDDDDADDDDDDDNDDNDDDNSDDNHDDNNGASWQSCSRVLCFLPSIHVAHLAIGLKTAGVKLDPDMAMAPRGCPAYDTHSEM